MTDTATAVKLHRVIEDGTYTSGAYYAETPAGRVDITPSPTETGRIDGWWTSLGSEDVLHRTLRDVREWIARRYVAPAPAAPAAPAVVHLLWAGDRLCGVYSTWDRAVAELARLEVAVRGTCQPTYITQSHLDADLVL
jgi:hypothetical protein